MRIVLASQSPRRKELLQLAGFDFTVMVADTDESYPADLTIGEIPMHIALQKAKAVAERTSMDDTVIVAADTIVVLDNEILGKPTDAADAMKMLSRLNGSQHEVYTGVALFHKAGITTFVERTVVYFNRLSAAQLQFYIDHFSPYDKAGGYGCQEWIGARAISRIEGDFYNVMGLPIHRVAMELDQLHA